MKNLTSALEKFSIFQSKSPCTTKFNVSVKTHTLTPVAAALLPFIRGFNPLPLAIYIACFALGEACVPEFNSGLFIGFVYYIVNISLAYILQYIKPLAEQDSNYLDFFINNPLAVTLILPVIEEIIFRGILLQTMLALTSTTTSINITAGLFGLVHFNNDHEGAYRQVFFTAFLGIVYGITAIKSGLGASIGAHIINNSIAYASVYVSLLSSSDSCEPPISLLEEIDELSSPELNIDKSLMVLHS